MNPYLSIVIPALNESETINRTLTHLVGRPTFKNAEIIVVDGNPACNTLDAITLAGVKKASAKHGRGGQMNHGAQMATGEMLLFLHADTFLEKGALKQIVETGQRSRIAGGAFRLAICSERSVFRVIETMVKLRTHLTRIPYGDQAIFLKTKRFYQIGCFKEIPIMEDVELMQRIKKRGWEIALLPQRAYTSPRRWHSEGVVRCTCRNWTIMLLFLMGVSPRYLARYYR